MREYPPAAVIHDASCTERFDDLLQFRAHLIPDREPYARAHHCVSPATVQQDHWVVAEPIDNDGHLYEPGDIRPDDATRPLCRHCNGTHGEVDVADWVVRS